MKMKISIILICLAVIFLTGCNPYITYEGERMKKSQAEEIMADKLEVENPNLDIEINISTGSD